MSADPDWSLYRTFLAVLDEGSLSGGARALGLAQPTIGRHIEALEQALGFALFTRSQHGLLPTETARQLKPYVEALASTAAALLRVASGQSGEARGVVRVTASEVIGAEVLPAILGPVREAHPGLAIELVLSNRIENLLHREADIAVRMVRPDQDALVARRVGPIPLGFFARQDYLQRHGVPETVADLGEHALIGFDRDAASMRALEAQIGKVDRDLFALRTDNQLAHLAAIRAGFGVGVCQVGLARRDPSLVRLLPEFEPSLDTWLAMHEDLKETRRCRVVFDALVEGLTRYIRE
ncbi:MAG TPA: LysR family transcriptional regulator [Roseiarcus sp.]|nr:LysR family transcriptional regulator [Roseiarcus sp.]